jgi:hypothetical protein
MKLTVTCQLCGKTLAVVEKDHITDDDIAMYEVSASCDTVQADGITLDGQEDIQATKTVN